MAETVALQYQYFGGEGNPPLILLHGLLGSARNWTTAARALAGQYEVFALDLRGHGQSPHAAPISVPVMAADVLAWLDRQKHERCFLLGHSMGGRVAMRFAVDYPERLLGLIVSDAAPRAYPPVYERELSLLQALPVSSIKTRKEAEEALEQDIPDWALRAFLLTNLERKGHGFRWTADIPGLLRDLTEIFEPVLQAREQYAGPALFLRGAESDLLLETDRETVFPHFPRHHWMTVANAGHLIHVDNREAFVAAVRYFGEDVLGGVSPDGTGGPCGI